MSATSDPIERVLVQWFRAEVRAVAAAIRPIEEVQPGFFGEAADVIRRQAAGDDMPIGAMLTALCRVRMALRALQPSGEAPPAAEGARAQMMAQALRDAGLSPDEGLDSADGA